MACAHNARRRSSLQAQLAVVLTMVWCVCLLHNVDC
jgi:hypothetical protein